MKFLGLILVMCFSVSALAEESAPQALVFKGTSTDGFKQPCYLTVVTSSYANGKKTWDMLQAKVTTPWQYPNAPAIKVYRSFTPFSLYGYNELAVTTSVGAEPAREVESIGLDLQDDSIESLYRFNVLSSMVPTVGGRSCRIESFERVSMAVTKTTPSPL